LKVAQDTLKRAQELTAIKTREVEAKSAEAKRLHNKVTQLETEADDIMRSKADTSGDLMFREPGESQEVLFSESEGEQEGGLMRTRSQGWMTKTPTTWFFTDATGCENGPFTDDRMRF
jgi:hypothetical protein